MHITNTPMYPNLLIGEGPSFLEITDTNKECLHLVQSESKGTGKDRRCPGMEILVEVLTEEKELQRKRRSCLVATCGHKGLKVQSRRMTEK